MKKVSVIVPVYNVEKYLTKCLDSLVNQTFDDYEIIIVNDGSPDNSEKIIKNYEKNYSIIKYYKKINGGLSDARNFGISKSSGKYVMFIDSDDYVSNDMIEKLYNNITKEKSDIAICNIIRVNHKNEEIKNYNYNPGTINIEEDKKILFNQPSACNKMYNKKLFNNNLFDVGKYYEDFRLINKLYLKCKKVSFIEDFCYYYVERENSIMNDTNIDKNYDIIDAIKSLIDFYEKEKKYLSFREEIEFLLIDNVIISAFTRIICSNKNYKEHLNKYWKYINDSFPNFKKNKYLKNLSRSRKIIYLLNSNKLYFLTKVIFKIKR